MTRWGIHQGKPVMLKEVCANCHKPNPENWHGLDQCKYCGQAAGVYYVPAEEIAVAQ